jgi:hypothetical protein
VAQAAKKRCFRDLIEGDEYDEETKNKKREEGGNTLLVLKRAPLRLPVKVFQEGSYQTVKAPEYPPWLLLCHDHGTLSSSCLDHPICSRKSIRRPAFLKTTFS